MTTFKTFTNVCKSPDFFQIPEREPRATAENRDHVRGRRVLHGNDRAAIGVRERDSLVQPDVIGKPTDVPGRGRKDDPLRNEIFFFPPLYSRPPFEEEEEFHRGCNEAKPNVEVLPPTNPFRIDLPFLLTPSSYLLTSIFIDGDGIEKVCERLINYFVLTEGSVWDDQRGISPIFQANFQIGQSRRGCSRSTLWITDFVSRNSRSCERFF